MGKTAFLLAFIALIAAGCGGQAPPGSGAETPKESLFDHARIYEAAGFSLFYPENWVLLDEQIVDGSYTLRFQEAGNAAAQVVASYFAVTGVSEKEALKDAESLLRSGLFHIQEKITTKKESIGSRRIPVLYTRSGDTETKIVHAAVIIGNKGFAVVTLLAREEAAAHFSPVFRLLLEGIEVE
jgi:hypothetical protein